MNKVAILRLVQQLQASVLSSSEWFWGCREASKSGLSSSEWFWGCREASKSGLSSFGVGHVTVSVKDTGAEHHHRI